MKTGEVFQLKDQITIKENSVEKTVLLSTPGLRLMGIAFAAGQELAEHTAPADALVFALEGEAIITHGGMEHKIKAGEQFGFAKGELHSVKAVTDYKMALLLQL